jgi:hypothetical protein
LARAGAVLEEEDGGRKCKWGPERKWGPALELDGGKPDGRNKERNCGAQVETASLST